MNLETNVGKLDGGWNYLDYLSMRSISYQDFTQNLSLSVLILEIEYSIFQKIYKCIGFLLNQLPLWLCFKMLHHQKCSYPSDDNTTTQKDFNDDEASTISTFACKQRFWAQIQTCFMVMMIPFLHLKKVCIAKEFTHIVCIGRFKKCSLMYWKKSFILSTM